MITEVYFHINFKPSLAKNLNENNHCILSIFFNLLNVSEGTKIEIKLNCIVQLQ